MFALRNCHASKDLPSVYSMAVIRKTFSMIGNPSVDNSDVIGEGTSTGIERFSHEEILGKRNKSRLFPSHRNMLHNRLPYTEPFTEHYNSLKYRRKMFGRYGCSCGVDPSLCWPTPEEILNLREYECVAHPRTVQEMIKMNEERKAVEKDRVLKRELDIAQKLAKLETWKAELNARIKKREADAAAAKAKKDRLIEEVRRHFGFKVDPRDERFKEMLEKKEKEEKKLAKDMKKKAREAKLLSQLADPSGTADVQSHS